MPATATPTGSSQIAPRRSDHRPNSGWISDEQKADARINSAASVYESPKRSLRKGSSAGTRAGGEVDREMAAREGRQRAPVELPSQPGEPSHGDTPTERADWDSGSIAPRCGSR